MKKGFITSGPGIMLFHNSIIFVSGAYDINRLLNK